LNWPFSPAFESRRQLVDVNEATRIAMMESVSLCEGIKIDRVSRLTRRIEDFDAMAGHMA